MASSETSWLLNLLHELHSITSHPPLLLYNNLGANFYGVILVFHSRMKDISLDYHFVREQIERGSLRVQHIANENQIAYLLTKPLAKSRFTTLRHKISVTNGTIILQGHVKHMGSAYLYRHSLSFISLVFVFTVFIF